MTTYRTTAAHELIDDLHCRIVRNEEAAKKATEPTQRAVYIAWRDATELALEELVKALPEIENEAELVPPPSAERWLEEQMADDLRDFPAA